MGRSEMLAQYSCLICECFHQLTGKKPKNFTFKTSQSRLTHISTAEHIFNVMSTVHLPDEIKEINPSNNQAELYSNFRKKFTKFEVKEDVIPIERDLIWLRGQVRFKIIEIFYLYFVYFYCINTFNFIV